LPQFVKGFLNTDQANKALNLHGIFHVSIVKNISVTERQQVVD